MTADPTPAPLAHAIDAEPLVKTHMGSDGEVPHTDPTALYLNGAGWVGLAMIALILIMLWKKVPALIGGMLDKRIAAIRTQLDEATRLRAEAEALRAEYKARADAASGDAEAIVAHAHAEAAAIVAKAKDDAETLIARRGRMAEDKIAAAERGAIAEVRAQAAQVAAQAAALLLAEQLDGGADKALVDRTIATIGTGTRLN